MFCHLTVTHSLTHTRTLTHADHSEHMRHKTAVRWQRPFITFLRENCFEWNLFTGSNLLFITKSPPDDQYLCLMCLCSAWCLLRRATRLQAWSVCRPTDSALIYHSHKVTVTVSTPESLVSKYFDLIFVRKGRKKKQMKTERWNLFSWAFVVSKKESVREGEREGGMLIQVTPKNKLQDKQQPQ